MVSINYSWIIIILAVIIILFLPSVSKEASNDKIIDSVPIEDRPIKLIQEDVYQTLEGYDIDESLNMLRRYHLQALKWNPLIPPVPPVYLKSPTDKGQFSSIGERHTIESLQLIFPGYSFKKVRPNWLKNPKTGRNLELDGYCPELKIAAEYNGQQHYVWPNFTKMSYQEFLQQVERDRLKLEICQNLKICLIRIPYTVPLNRIPLAVYSKLLESVPEFSLNSNG